MPCPGLGDVSAAQVNAAAQATGLPCAVVYAQIAMESGGRNGLTSSAGAVGVAQFLPSTFSGLGCKGSPSNVADAMGCYGVYMGQLLHDFGGNVQKALAAYNAGPGNIGAGMGYANTILANAKAGPGLTAGGGSGGGAGSGGGSGSSSGGGGSSAGRAGTGTAADYMASLAPITPAGDIGTTSFLGDIFSAVLDPFKELFGAEKRAADFFAQPLTTFYDVFSTISAAWIGVAGAIQTVFKDILWLFNPSHWIRIFCFIFGIAVAIPAMYALMHTGTGDFYLAMGIALTVISGGLLFLAFHNLPFVPPSADNPKPPAGPDNVISWQALLAYISQGIRQGTTTSGTTLDAYYLGSQQAPPQAIPAQVSAAVRKLGFGAFTGPSATGFQPVADATSIFPIIGQISPTPSGNPPISTTLTGG